MIPLSFLSIPLVQYSLAGGLVITAAAWGMDQVWTKPELRREIATANAGKATAEKNLSDAIAAGEVAARKQADDYRRREASLQLSANAAQKDADAKVQTLTAQLGSARSSERRMRDRIDSLVAAARSAAPSASGAAGGGETASDPAGVLGRLCSESDRRAGVLAEYADRLRISAEACVSAWPRNEEVTP